MMRLVAFFRRPWAWLDWTILGALAAVGALVVMIGSDARRRPPCDPGYTPTTWPSGAVTCLAREGAVP